MSRSVCIFTFVCFARYGTAFANHLMTTMCVHLTFSLVSCMVVIPLDWLRPSSHDNLTMINWIHARWLCYLGGMTESLLTCHFLLSFRPTTVHPLTVAPTFFILDCTFRFCLLLICRVFGSGFESFITTGRAMNVHIRCCTAFSINLVLHKVWIYRTYAAVIYIYI